MMEAILVKMAGAIAAAYNGCDGDGDGAKNQLDATISNIELNQSRP